MNLLQIYVASHCVCYDEAVRLASVISERFPTLSVKIVDLDQANSPQSDQVFAVPTYVLDGQILALGNPREAELEDWLAKEMEGGEASH